MRGCDFPRPVENTYQCIRQLSRDINDEFDGYGFCAIAVAGKVDHSVRVGARNSAQFADWNPVLGKRPGFLGIKKSVGLLIPEQASLNLHVCAVVIRQRGAPIQAIFVTTPRPNLLRRKVQRRRVMDNPRISVRMVDRHVRLPATVAEARHRTILMIADNTLVNSSRIYRPGVDVCESM